MRNTIFILINLYKLHTQPFTYHIQHSSPAEFVYSHIVQKVSY